MLLLKVKFLYFNLFFIDKKKKKTKKPGISKSQKMTPQQKLIQESVEEEIKEMKETEEADFLKEINENRNDSKKGKDARCTGC